MVKMIVLATLGSVIVFGGYMMLFQREQLFGLVGISVGYGPAKTPEEAIEKFKKAIKARNYAQAVKYVGGPYGEQLQAGAEKATELGKAIDALGAAANKRGITLNNNVKVLLVSVEPFPTAFEVSAVQKKSDDLAMATFSQPGFWTMPHVELKPEGQGEERSWKIFFPNSHQWSTRQNVNYVFDKHKDFARALEKVTDRIKDKSITTKDELEAELKTELAAAAKD
jgi:hypothetical protein